MQKRLALAILPLCCALCAAAQSSDLSASSLMLPQAPSLVLALRTSISPDDAQQTPAPMPSSSATPAAQSPSATHDSPQSESERQLKKEESQRMLGVIPAFNEVMGGHAPPLSSRQKFDLFFHSAFDPYQFGIVALDAGIEQWQDQFPEYHFGIQGYSRRYAASFGDNFDGNFWGNAVLPTLLHQDPRYYRLGSGHILHRIVYAAATTVICKGDNGRWQPNISNVAGNLIGGGLSNFYYPAADRGIGLTFQRGLTISAEGAFGALAEEFYPDFASYFSHRHARKDAAKASATSAAGPLAPSHPAPGTTPPAKDGAPRSPDTSPTPPCDSCSALLPRFAAPLYIALPQSPS